jgi:hypothetical protein
MWRRGERENPEDDNGDVRAHELCYVRVAISEKAKFLKISVRVALRFIE